MGIAAARPLRAVRSIKHLAQVRGRDLQLFAVLCDRAPSELEPFPLQAADNLQITQRLPWMFLLVTTRLTVDSCMPMSLATSRSTSGRKYSMPWSRNSFWKLMMLVATLWMVFWRCSTDLISHSADRNLSCLL